MILYHSPCNLWVGVHIALETANVGCCIMVRGIRFTIDILMQALWHSQLFLLQGVFGPKIGFGRNEQDPYRVGTKGGFGITGVGNQGIGMKGVQSSFISNPDFEFAYLGL